MDCRTCFAIHRRKPTHAVSNLKPNREVSKLKQLPVYWNAIELKIYQICFNTRAFNTRFNTRALLHSAQSHRLMSKVHCFTQNDRNLSMQFVLLTWIKMNHDSFHGR